MKSGKILLLFGLGKTLKSLISFSVSFVLW